MKNVIFLAPPLAGKGTFSDYLKKTFGYEHFSTGSILREKAVTDPFLKDILESGTLVTDEIILPLIEDVLKKRDKSKPFILDGVPRTLYQAQRLDQILSDLDIHDLKVISIEVSKSTLIDRVLSRRVCSKCYRSYSLSMDLFKPKMDHICDACGSLLITRSDDNLEAFEVRYETYLKNTCPIIDYYRKKGCLENISNQASQEEALEKLRSVVL